MRQAARRPQEVEKRCSLLALGMILLFCKWLVGFTGKSESLRDAAFVIFSLSSSL